MFVVLMNIGLFIFTIILIKVLKAIYIAVKDSQYDESIHNAEDNESFKLYKTGKRYNTGCILRHLFITITFFIIGMIGSICVICYLDNGDCNFLKHYDSPIILGLVAFFCLLPAAVLAALGSMFTSYLNIEIGQSLPKTDVVINRINKEHFNIKIGVASLIFNLGHLIHKTKRAADDICNVDSWDKMK